MNLLLCVFKKRILKTEIMFPSEITPVFNTLYANNERAAGGVSIFVAGGAKVLGKLPVPGRPTNLDYSRARACCTCISCGLGLFGRFFSPILLSPLPPSLWETARYRLKYCLKGPLNPKQPTNQPTPNYLHLLYYRETLMFFLSSITSLFFLPLSGRRPDID